MHFYVIPATWVAECMHFYVIPATWVAQCMHFYVIPATGLQNVCIFMRKMHTFCIIAIKKDVWLQRGTHVHRHVGHFCRYLVLFGHLATRMYAFLRNSRVIPATGECTGAIFAAI